METTMQLYSFNHAISATQWSLEAAPCFNTVMLWEMYRLQPPHILEGLTGRSSLKLSRWDSGNLWFFVNQCSCMANTLMFSFLIIWSTASFFCFPEVRSPWIFMVAKAVLLSHLFGSTLLLLLLGFPPLAPVTVEVWATPSGTQDRPV